MTARIRALTIGDLAKAARVSTPTIRYYEEIGLLARAERGASGQRIYSDTDIARLTFIRRCRDFGFPIEQVRVLSGLSISTDRDCGEVRDIAQAHLREVRAKLDELQGLEKSLDAFVEQCDIVCAGGPGCDCVVFKSLAATHADG